MRALVAYYTVSGNTEKVARAIFESIDLVEKEILPISEIKGVEGYDVIFCGFPVQVHSVPGKMETFIKGIPEDKKLAFFATHGSHRGGRFAMQAFYYAMSLAPRNVILGTFGCRGKVHPGVLAALPDMAEYHAWAIEAQGAHEHPHEADLEDARAWARAMIAKARTYEPHS